MPFEMLHLHLAVFERDSLRVASDDEVAHQRRLARARSFGKTQYSGAPDDAAHMPMHAGEDAAPGGSVDGDLMVTEPEAALLNGLNKTQKGFCKREGRNIQLSMHCGLILLPGSGNRIISGGGSGLPVEPVTLEILPKIWGGIGKRRQSAGIVAGSGARRETLTRARRALLRLLRCSENLSIPRLDAAPQDADHAPLLDLFIRSFLRETLRVAKSGLLTRYIEVVDDQPVMRGRPLLFESERLAATRPGLWRCSRDDLSVDNPYNQALLAAIERCRPHLRRRATERLWLEARAFLGEVSHVRMTPEAVDRIKRGRESARYTEALRWARLLLALLSPTLSGGVSAAPALLFNMQVLFERWVARHERDRAPEGANVQLKGASRDLARVGFGGALAGKPHAPNADQVFRHMPDVLIWGPGTDRVVGSPEAIIDAKWKRLRPSREDWGVDEGDVRQVLAYMIRFGCQRARIAYPILSDSELPVGGPPTFWIDVPAGTVSIEVSLVPIDAE